MTETTPLTVASTIVISGLIEVFCGLLLLWWHSQNMREYLDNVEYVRTKCDMLQQWQDELTAREIVIERTEAELLRKVKACAITGSVNSSTRQVERRD